MSKNNESSVYQEFSHNLQNLSDKDRERMRREILGQTDEDLLRRGDIYQVLRQLRVTNSNPHYQKAISDALVSVSRIEEVQ